MTTSGGGFNWSMEHFIDIARSVFGSSRPCMVTLLSLAWEKLGRSTPFGKQ